jgi:hypothetical protein
MSRNTIIVLIYYYNILDIIENVYQCYFRLTDLLLIGNEAYSIWEQVKPVTLLYFKDE